MCAHTLIQVGYNIDPAKLKGGKHDFISNFALVDKTACPIQTHTSGVMKEANASLFYGSMDMHSLNVSYTNGVSLAKQLTCLDGATFSSFFLAEFIMESIVSYPLFQSYLVEEAATESGSPATVYAVDGGYVDTTGWYFKNFSVKCSTNDRRHVGSFRRCCCIATEGNPEDLCLVSARVGTKQPLTSSCSFVSRTSATFTRTDAAAAATPALIVVPTR